jgi:formate dehydrogenase iron-sulfur subunit
MCADRVMAGQQTACADACPTGATKFGERDALIAEAKDRIAGNPGQYINHIYGLEEVGGTSVLLLSSVPFANFGYPSDLSSEPRPLLTHQALAHIPDVLTLGGLLLGGIWWITNRRSEVALAEAEASDSESRGKRREG